MKVSAGSKSRYGVGPTKLQYGLAYRSPLQPVSRPLRPQRRRYQRGKTLVAEGVNHKALATGTRLRECARQRFRICLVVPPIVFSATHATRGRVADGLRQDVCLKRIRGDEGMHLRPDDGSRSVRNLPGGYEAGGLSCAAGAAHGCSNSETILLPHRGNVSPVCPRLVRRFASWNGH